jgi:nucleoside-triphosphatase THEP1
MTDRIHSLTVVLETDMRIDEIGPLQTAIRSLRNVAYVEAHVTDVTALMAQVRADQKWRDRLVELIRMREEGRNDE